MGPLDLVGRRLGLWTVLSVSPERTSEGRRYLNCRCDCGTERKVSTRKLRRGESKSCGCQAGRVRKTSGRLTPPVVNIGDVFGSVTVRGSDEALRFDCACKCGRSHKLTAGQLGTLSFFCECLTGKIQNRFYRRRKDYMKSARERGFTWALDIATSALLFRAPCTYCGRAPADPDRGGGIDRVDNTQGYVPGNVVPCCWTCNRAKGTLTSAEFETWLEGLIKFRSKAA